jgi:hypothetical protein
METVIEAARWATSLAGLALLWAAFFLYEDAEGRIQNRLEEWWIRLDDARHRAVTRHTAFLRLVAESTTRALDHVLGRRLMSAQAVSVSALLSLAAMFFFSSFTRLPEDPELEEIVFVPTGVDAWLASTIDVIDDFILEIGFGRISLGSPLNAFLVGCLFCGLAVWAAASKPGTKVAVSVLIYVIVLAFADHQFGIFYIAGEIDQEFGLNGIVGAVAEALAWPYIEVFAIYSFDAGTRAWSRLDARPIVGAIPVGMACDVMAVIFGRRVIADSRGLTSFVAIIGLLSLALSFSLLLLVLPVFHGIRSESQFWIYVGASNLFTSATIWVFVVLSLTMLLHKVVWPILQRPVYAAARHHLISNRRLLVSGGLILLTFGNAWLSGVLYIFEVRR